MNIENWTKFNLLESETLKKIDTFKSTSNNPYIEPSNQVQQDLEDYFITILDRFNFKFEVELKSIKRNFNDKIDITFNRFDPVAVNQPVYPIYRISITGQSETDTITEEEVIRVLQKIKNSKRYKLGQVDINLRRNIKDDYQKQEVSIYVIIHDRWGSQINPTEMNLRKALKKAGFENPYSSPVFDYRKEISLQKEKSVTEVLKQISEEHKKLGLILKGLEPLKVVDQEPNRDGSGRIRVNRQYTQRRWTSLQQFEKFCSTNRISKIWKYYFYASSQDGYVVSYQVDGGRWYRPTKESEPIIEIRVLYNP